MTTFPYCILLLFYSHLQVQSASSGGPNIGVTSEKEEEKCSAENIDKLSETMDIVCRSNVKLKLNDTQVYLEELRKELSKNRDSTEKQHLENVQRIQVALSEIKEYLSKAGISGQQTDGGSSVLGPRDCSDIRVMGFTTSGVYRIYAGDDRKRMPADVHCDFNRFNESWLVLQRRVDGSVNFERNYTQYENGFGNLSGEFWIGNELLHLLTKDRKYKLRIDLEDFEGEKRYAEYSTFVVNSRADSYRLTVAGYTGNAGDSFGHQNNSRFSTFDMDNDNSVHSNCAIKFGGGGWWYGVICHQSSLNGRYLQGNHTSFADGINWFHWHGFYYSLKRTEMKLAPL